MAGEALDCAWCDYHTLTEVELYEHIRKQRHRRSEVGPAGWLVVGAVMIIAWASLLSIPAVFIWFAYDALK